MKLLIEKKNVSKIKGTTLKWTNANVYVNNKNFNQERWNELKRKKKRNSGSDEN